MTQLRIGTSIKPEPLADVRRVFLDLVEFLKGEKSPKQGASGERGRHADRGGVRFSSEKILNGFEGKQSTRNAAG